MFTRQHISTLEKSLFTMERFRATIYGFQAFAILAALSQIGAHIRSRVSLETTSPCVCVESFSLERLR